MAVHQHSWFRKVTNEEPHILGSATGELWVNSSVCQPFHPHPPLSWLHPGPGSDRLLVFVKSYWLCKTTTTTGQGGENEYNQGYISPLYLSDPRWISRIAFSFVPISNLDIRFIWGSFLFWKTQYHWALRIELWALLATYPQTVKRMVFKGFCLSQYCLLHYIFGSTAV